MHSIISVEEAVAIDSPVFIDVRSPAEYETGHIPGAVNIPLFSDDERVQVGTTYRQVGVEEAKLQGLVLASAKLPDIVGRVQQLRESGRKVVVYCWRGGMRSKAVVTVLELMGILSSQLSGGYKAYRQFVLNRLRTFEVKPIIIVLCGSTGTGKTLILNQLANANIPVINLEQLANHRGSVFGQIGLGRPATAQIFDTNLLLALDQLNTQPYIVVECESKRIGNVYLPDCLFDAMRRGKKILVSADIEVRVDRLIKEYIHLYKDKDNDEAIVAGLESLRRRLGNKKTEYLLADFRAGKVRDVVKVLLVDYYDLMYGYGQSDTAIYDVEVNADDIEQATEVIIQYLQQFGR
ncbi:tRNA 2-selenouridine(34) synthase MnmH [Sporomusa sphaeroides]|uniref:tRNA 2-selenouridine synthase n=2 Tax=Sporomusa TaxID=2375 RepID=A0ABP2C2N0_9FIRM|nr:tRNA 2-selenouridine(34) synthase MnmH [Sporomusa sphaeroides]OLS58229.1 tRNA 2-selenouridine synthase [Sporomusa sphaeroides DSM 2875]CVK17584.1 tRNA 2-selenouridine synthase [Sporomusa sphaeroides DSM 2875]SCM80391.1 Sulfurtransferase [uncultured Sporomusa sp.]